MLFGTKKYTAYLSGLYLAFALVCGTLHAQPGSKPPPLKPADLGITSKKALSFYEDGRQQMQYRDYPAAKRAYDKALELEPNFIHAHYQVGACIYLMSHVQTRTGYYLRKEILELIPHLEKAVAAKPDAFPAAYFYLGEAYFQDIQYVKARDAYKRYLTYNGQIIQDVNVAKANLQSAEFAVEAIKSPVSFEPVNLGDSINTDGEEYMPYLTADGGTLFFTARKPGCIGGFNNYNQSYLEDFYTSKYENGSWREAQNIGPPLNSDQNEGAATFSQDGRMVIFTACERRGGFGVCDLYWAVREGDTWTTPQSLGPRVNTPFWEAQPSLAHDNRTLYFASNRPGGLGKNDIWVTRLEKGYWTEAVNVGAPLNTAGNEYYPFIHADGLTMYFTSDGRPGFGGLDFYMSRKNGENWGNPENLGYPINSPGEEHSLYVAPAGDRAFLSSTRLKGKGGFDIWEFKLDKKIQPQRAAYLRGFVFDSLNGKPLTAKVTLVDLETKEILRKVETDEITGRFILSLPLGKKYAAYAEAKGYLFHSSHFSLDEMENKSGYDLNIKLQPVQKNAAVVLKNVFFDTDSYKLKPESFVELDKLATFLTENAGLRIELGGHTDSQAADAYNLTLSDNRAKAVRAYLIEKGVAESRLTAKGYGETVPIASNETNNGRALNRRTEFKIIETK